MDPHRARCVTGRGGGQGARAGVRGGSPHSHFTDYCVFEKETVQKGTGAKHAPVWEGLYPSSKSDWKIKLTLLIPEGREEA